MGIAQMFDIRFCCYQISLALSRLNESIQFWKVTCYSWDVFLDTERAIREIASAESCLHASQACLSIDQSFLQNDFLSRLLSSFAVYMSGSETIV